MWNEKTRAQDEGRLLNLFECKVCNEKDKRIHDLLTQVGVLTKLIFPSHVPTDSLPIIDLDAVEPGGAMPPDLTLQEIEQEADRLLTGNY